MVMTKFNLVGRLLCLPALLPGLALGYALVDELLDEAELADLAILAALTLAFLIAPVLGLIKPTLWRIRGVLAINGLLAFLLFGKLLGPLEKPVFSLLGEFELLGRYVVAGLITLLLLLWVRRRLGRWADTGTPQTAGTD
jgi:hypothetical protein